MFTDLVTVTKLPKNLSKSTGEKHKCSICGRGYSFRSGLSKHMRSAHNDVESGLVTCTICNSRFVIHVFITFLIHVFYQRETGLQKLLLHLQSSHQLSIEKKEISFNTLEEFYEWKEEFETTTRSLFVLKCTPQVSSNGMKVFYYFTRCFTGQAHTNLRELENVN